MANEVAAVIHSDPNIMGESGNPLGEFLEDFPTVSRDQPVAALEQAKEALLSRAHSA